MEEGRDCAGWPGACGRAGVMVGRDGAPAPREEPPRRGMIEIWR